VLSYDALSEGVTADAILDRVLEAVDEPEDRYLHRSHRTAAA
jgi:MoxR-like ATPase